MVTMLNQRLFLSTKLRMLRYAAISLVLYKAEISAGGIRGGRERKLVWLDFGSSRTETRMPRVALRVGRRMHMHFNLSQTKFNKA
jgi:hypothetical protein